MYSLLCTNSDITMYCASSWHTVNINCLSFLWKRSPVGHTSSPLSYYTRNHHKIATMMKTHDLPHLLVNFLDYLWHLKTKTLSPNFASEMPYQNIILVLVIIYIISIKMLRLTCTKRYCCDGTPVLLKFHQSFIKLNIMYNDMTWYKTNRNNIHCWSLQEKLNTNWNEKGKACCYTSNIYTYKIMYLSPGQTVKK